MCNPRKCQITPFSQLLIGFLQHKMCLHQLGLWIQHPHGWLYMHVSTSIALKRGITATHFGVFVRMCVHVCVHCVCMCVCVHAVCMCACVYECTCVYVCVYV